MQCPSNTHELYFVSCVSRLKEKKKDRPTDPPNFQANRANKPFIFLGLRIRTKEGFHHKQVLSIDTVLT